MNGREVTPALRRTVLKSLLVGIIASAGIAGLSIFGGQVYNSIQRRNAALDSMNKQTAAFDRLERLIPSYVLTKQDYDSARKDWEDIQTRLRRGEQVDKTLVHLSETCYQESRELFTYVDNLKSKLEKEAGLPNR